MLNLQALSQLTQPYEPRLPVADMVTELNRIYHSIEASQYSNTHPEIFDQLRQQWNEMTSKARALIPAPKWRILDFGCGTGFEAIQVLKNNRERITAITCYDLSPEMLTECRRHVAPLFPQVHFQDEIDELLADRGQYNLLLTNSLLHHLTDPVKTLKLLLPLLTKDAVWIAGHEPASRFYNNAECLDALHRFEREQRRRRILSGQSLVHRLKRRLGLFKPGIAQQTANEAFRRGLFGRLPPGFVVSRLVDVGVAHSSEEVADGRGLDFERMQKDFAGNWSLEWVNTYAFFGSFLEAKLPPKWKQTYRELAEKYPHDGSNFSTIWKRIGV